MLEWTRDRNGSLVGALAPLILRIECSRCHQMRPSPHYPAVIGSPPICNSCSGSAQPRFEVPERGNAVEVARHTTGAPPGAVCPPPRAPSIHRPTRARMRTRVRTPQTTPNRTPTVPQNQNQPLKGAVEKLICPIQGGLDCKTHTTGDRTDGGTDTN